MRKIILIRHAKATKDISYKDINRPLIEIGVLRAEKVARQSQKLVKSKFYVTSSPSIRTIETAKIFLQIWNKPFSSVTIIPELYTFMGSQLEEIVKSYPNNQKNVILFGHNDAITDFVNKFGDIKILNVPTAGFVEIIFNSNDWKSINKGKINAVIFPNDYKL